MSSKVPLPVALLLGSEPDSRPSHVVEISFKVEGEILCHEKQTNA